MPHPARRAATISPTGASADYAGVGPGAHGRRGALATTRHKKPENWLAALDRNGHGLQEERQLPPEERAARSALMMGLRLAEGIDLDDLAVRTGLTRNALINEAAAAARLVSHGLLSRDGNRLIVTPRGMLLLDGILGEIVEI